MIAVDPTWANQVTILESELRPDVAFEVESPEAYHEALGQLLEGLWPQHRASRSGPRRHQWADYYACRYAGRYLRVECPTCRTRFHVLGQGGEWVCECPDCVQDAGSAEDGVMPARGVGSSLLEAAADWMENQ